MNNYKLIAKSIRKIIIAISWLEICFNTISINCRSRFYKRLRSNNIVTYYYVVTYMYFLAKNLSVPMVLVVSISGDIQVYNWIYTYAT